MNKNIGVLVEKIRLLESELEAELAIRRADLQYRLEGGRALFDREILGAHRKLKVGLSRYVFNAGIMKIITAPVIYSLIIPFVLAICSSPSISRSAFRSTKLRKLGAATI